jgi:hypothetical protein
MLPLPPARASRIRSCAGHAFQGIAAAGISALVALHDGAAGSNLPASEFLRAKQAIHDRLFRFIYMNEL